ncbi:MAG: ABC transporter ATP-binding protein [Alphaproteobacteria bacterium]|nr:MAG: ABC transporter ATP-binding protein [Alphaproteobacteria bacterium]
MSFLAVEGLTKTYPGVVANDNVDLEVEQGEIHALLGENGAGKSTLVKAIYGLVHPDAGRMTINGKPYAPTRPVDARDAHIAMVFQHFSLFEALSVVENIALGIPPERAGRFGGRTLAERIRRVSEEYGLPIDPHRMVGTLSAGERQRVEIIRCLLQVPRLLIMDEPTSVLTPQEAESLFGTLRKLARDGVAILYISHKLEEIRALCDHATILRGGKVVAHCDPREKSARELAELMIGTELAQPPVRKPGAAEVLMKVDRLSLPASDPFGIALDDISFDLHAGEILGIGGIAGNGQEELLAAISGERPVEREMVMLGRRAIGHYPPTRRRKLGICSAPEERLGHAAAPDMTLTENALLSGMVREKLANGGFINWSASRYFARAVVESFDVRTPGIEVPARSLSGGNLQKFVIGREVLQRPVILAVNQPTWGVDAAAAAAIRTALVNLAAEGAGVLVISQDLDELMEISHRFAVLAGGRLSPPRPTETYTIDEIGLMMGGKTREDADVAS